MPEILVIYIIRMVQAFTALAASCSARATAAATDGASCCDLNQQVECWICDLPGLVQYTKMVKCVLSTSFSWN